MAKNLNNSTRGQRAKNLAVAFEVKERAKRNKTKREARARIEAKARLEAVKARPAEAGE